MKNLFLHNDQKQVTRILRHLTGVLFSLIFTAVSIVFFRYEMLAIDSKGFYSIIIFFWSGGFIFTILIRSGINKKFPDPSLTVAQILWCTLFVLTITYLLNEWRGLILVAFFGVFSFGYFKLNFREFLSLALFAVLGYSLIILYGFIYEPERNDTKLDLLQLLTFTTTILIMLYTGSSIHHLRINAKKQYLALQDALELNKTLATTDELTGLYNRRHFMEKLAQQKALSERNNSDFVICFCDLDHFKHINDTFGHHTGDIVLQKFSEILKMSIREVDFAARFGGEEFVCLLVDTDINNAKKVSERIRTSLANYNFSDIAPSLHATVSIGVSNFKQFNTIQETLMSADNRMYLAKELGRNRVVTSDEDKTAADKEEAL